MTAGKVLPFLPVIVGPTASAKSALASLLAQDLGGEVLSADSVQVYRHFDVGAGKPSPEERARAPHHLLDIRDPLDVMEATVWADLALEEIRRIRERGAVPLVCGGTFLWVRALVYGLVDTPSADALVRARHNELVAVHGRPYLHSLLAEVDPVSAERLHENDTVRVSRALEVFELSGRPLSAFQAEHGFRSPRFEPFFISVGWEKPDYEARLSERTRAMFRHGFVDEVRALISAGYLQARAMDAVGYRQVSRAVQNEQSGQIVDEELLFSDVLRVTRIFARRQRTWLRDEPVRYVSPETLTSPSVRKHLVDEIRQRL